MSYTKKALLSNLDKELQCKLLPPDEKDCSLLYTMKALNYSGVTTDSKELFTEVIAENLIKHGFIEDQIPDIKTITRQKSYYTKSHENFSVAKDSNRVEENFVKSLFFYNPYKEQIGTPIDYQTPLKNISKDKAGKIDLITFKEDSNEILLVEVKDDDSRETALRACLEIQTYYQVVNKEKLVEDFHAAEKISSKNPAIKKAVMFFKGTTPANEIADLDNRPMLKKVIKTFDIEIIIIEPKEALNV